MTTSWIEEDYTELHATVEYCDDCHKATVHMAADEGFAICSLCGDSPEFDDLELFDTYAEA